MPSVTKEADRRRNTDVIFETLYEQISSLELLPGAKISEAEIATRFGVSRQPVRDAFSRLETLDLIQIRPQRATEIKKFSIASIEHARFVRLSVELEVLRRTAERWDQNVEAQFEENLSGQEHALTEGDVERFHSLDYDFHKLICQAGGMPSAFDVIIENKAKLDRICVLGLVQEARMAPLIDDHKRIFEYVSKGKTAEAVRVLRHHLARMDETLHHIHQKHGEYFSG